MLMRSEAILSLFSPPVSDMRMEEGRGDGHEGIRPFFMMMMIKSRRGKRRQKRSPKTLAKHFFSTPFNWFSRPSF